MTFLHMHSVMATNAIMRAKYKEGLADTDGCLARVREIIMSGQADYKDRWFPVVVTGEDRLLVCRFLGV